MSPVGTGGHTEVASTSPPFAFPQGQVGHSLIPTVLHRQPSLMSYPPLQQEGLHASKRGLAPERAGAQTARSLQAEEVQGRKVGHPAWVTVQGRNPGRAS